MAQRPNMVNIACWQSRCSNLLKTTDMSGEMLVDT